MKLNSIVMPLTEFDHPEKGDALYGKYFFKFFFFLSKIYVLHALILENKVS